jgi:serine/threonine protein kinase
MDAPPSLHPTDQVLHAYGLGKLDEAEAESVNAHLEACEDCRRRAAEMSSDSFLGRFRDGRPTGGHEPPAPAPAGSAAPSPVGALPPELAHHQDYEVVRELGHGGMGVVYLVRNRLMGRDEVLKVMAGHLVERPEVRERFLREIRAVASLRHPNIVAAHHAFHVGETIAFTMEYVDGYDLARMVKARGPLPVPHACLFAHQASLGLQHAHEEGMVHRDIKPGNLMVARRGEKAVVKILDFGLAKAAREGQFDGALTHAGQMLGTPDFIAPEQIVDAQHADIRADIYSLGCTLYYLLSGGPPFRATSLYDLLQAHHSMDAKPLNLARHEVPTELAAMVAKMMAKEPERRFRTPAEVSEALAPFARKGSPSPRSVVPEISQAAPMAPAPGLAPAEPEPASREPDGPPRPEEMWASLIDHREKESKVEEMPPEPVASAPARRPPWKSWPAIAAAALFGFIALGIIIYIRIDKDGVKAVIRSDDASAARVKDEADNDPARAEEVRSPAEDVKEFAIKKTIGQASETGPEVGSTTSHDATKVAPAVGTGGSTAGAGAVPGSPPAPLAAELVAFYDFDDGRATDRSGHGHHGTFSVDPPTFTRQGREKGALSFDAQRKTHVLLPINIDPSQMPQVTMGGWFRANSSASNATLMSHDDGGFDRHLGIDRRGAPGFRWSTFRGRGVLGGDPVAAGRWTFVVMRHDQKTGKLVLDVDGHRISDRGSYGAGRSQLFIGKHPKYTGHFDGAMDNLFVYKGFLTDAKIDDIRARGSEAILPSAGPSDSDQAPADEPMEPADAAPEAGTPRPAPPAAKSASRAAPFHFVDEFGSGRRGLPADPNIPHELNHGRSDGVFFVYSEGRFHGLLLHNFVPDSTCEVVGRVLSTDPRRTACWGVGVVRQAEPHRGFVVKINRKGELFLEPNPYPGGKAYRQVDPSIGPITHPAIRPGSAYNKLQLVVKNRELVILVNGIQVYRPVRFDYDPTPAKLSLGAGGPGMKRAEFDRLEIQGIVDSQRAGPKVK